MLMVIALTSGAALLWPVLAQGAASGLTTAQAVQLINREKAVVIDVCEAEEFAQGHVAGARNVPLAQLEAQLPKWVKNKTTPVVMLCQSGARAARFAINGGRKHRVRARWALGPRSRCVGAIDAHVPIGRNTGVAAGPAAAARRASSRRTRQRTGAVARRRCAHTGLRRRYA